MLATLLPGAAKIPIGRNRVWRGALQTQSGKQVSAYVKLHATDGALCKEALAAILAQAVGLPVPEVYLVRISAMSLPAEEIPPNALGLGLANASVPDLSQRFSDADAIASALSGWRQLYPCAAFDAWVGVSDRLPRNLLYGGRGDFRVIDFDDALADYLAPTSAPANAILRAIAFDLSEHERYAARKELLRAASGFGAIILDHERLERMFSLLRLIPNWENTRKSSLDLLKSRVSHLPRIFNQQLGIKQQESFTMNQQHNEQWS